VIITVGRATAVALVLAAGVAHAQNDNQPRCLTARLVDPHGAVSGPVVRAVLAQPHEMLCAPDTNTVTLSKGANLPKSIVLIGKKAAVEDTVHGDVLMIGGDLFLHPGSYIDGHAISICGGVYPSANAVVRYGVVIEKCDKLKLGIDGPTVTVEYWPRGLAPPVAVRLPSFYGFRIPSYDRSDGLSAGWGPTLNFDSLRLHVAPMITYRSNLGHWDPSLTVGWSPARETNLTFVGERGTYTNDEWSRPTIFNSTATLGTGSDARNYYRADHFSLIADHHFGDKLNNITPYVQVTDEFDRSVGPDLHSRHYAWSLIDPLDTSGIRRVNPGITRGRIISGAGGFKGLLTAGEYVLSGSMSVEVPFTSPVSGTWVQTTLDGDLKMPAIADNTLELTTHDVVTAGDPAPAQRYAYLGGAATLPTLFMLQEGGDDLVWAAANYLIPIHIFQIPLFGPPEIGAYYTVGTAGIRRLPHFTNNVGPQVIVGIFQILYLYDPGSRKHNFAVGAVLPANLTY
jgi:hypothetical protein